MRGWSRKGTLAAVAALACVSGIAVAAGPDVIVGDIPDVVDLGSSGGRHAYAFGTTSCNLGTQMLSWVSGSNQHPVISQNIYRIQNGRFQQLSQAWLKHGFCALQGTVCSSSCQPNPNGCPALGVQCSDPYSASLNGGQSGLGPKSEVNAASGAFPYPWVNNSNCATPSYTTLCKRLQPLESDLALPGALYFFAAMYVQPEDAASHNNNNNESYRRITINSSYGVSLADTTQRTKAAIYAWQDHGLGANTPDASVLITPVDVASDGRFLIASRVTNSSPGVWHYEYAVQNLNSDRSGGSFSIPVAAGTISNIGFYAPPYHSGEPYDGSAWTGAFSAGAVTWTCPQTYAQNQNANALRWDTIYNFWFDSDRAPVAGNASIGLFKPGAGTSVSGLANVVGTSTTGGSGNDNCSSPTIVGSGTVTFNTTNATTDGPSEPGACNTNSHPQYDKDVWFLYTSANCAGNVTISTAGSSFDTKLIVYPGTVCPAAGTSIACNDDIGGGVLQSSVTFSQTANTSYLIRVGGYNGASGAGQLTITPPSCGPVAPPNDTCANAIQVAAGVAVNGDTSLATHDVTPSCGSSTGPDVWYKYTPQTTGSVTISTCGSGYDTVLTAYSGACGSLAELANGCNDDAGTACASNNLNSQITVSMTAGQTYYIRVGGYQNLSGSFTLLVTGGGGVVPPANNDCANRAGIGLGATAFNTAGATTDGPTHTGCNFFNSNQIYNDIWYNHPCTFNGRLKVSTCGAANFDTKIAVYSGTGCANYDARLMNCVDDTPGCATNTTTVLVNVYSGQNYTIRLGSFASNATGTGTLTLTRYCTADYDDGSGTGNPDGGVTIDDLLYYLGIFNAGNRAADVDDGSGLGHPDGGVTIDDLLYYLDRFNIGC